jgi:AraC-like DNA-binding protein
MKNLINERLPLSKSLPLRARFYDYKHFTYPWHFHSEYEIIYIKESSGTRFVGNSSDKFENGNIFLLGSNLPHYMKSDEVYHANNELRVKGTIIQFEKDFMYHSISYYPHFFKIKKLLEESQNGIFFPSGCSVRLIELLGKIPLETSMDQMILFLELLKVMSETSSRKIISSSDFSNEILSEVSRVDKVISFLNKNYTRKIDLDEIASFAAMNPTAFCRFFKSHAGKSFKNYILELRVSYACKLLMMSDKNISQISTECGFDTISHFNKTFKKRTGYTPSTYRTNMMRS